MNRLKSGSAAIAVIVCFAAELAFSNALSIVFKLCGKMAPFCILLGGGLITILILFANKLKSKLIVFILSAVCIAMLFIRLSANVSYLYNGKFELCIILGAVALLAIAFFKGIKGAGIYSALCFIPLIIVFVVCCILGGTDINFSFYNGMASFNMLYGTAVSILLFLPNILCSMLISEKNINNAVIASGACVVLISAMMLIAVGVFGSTARDYPSVIAEMSKNVSVGKFFQRLEGFADASYIVAASAVIVILGAAVGECFNITKLKLKKAVATVVAVALLSVSMLGCTAKREIESQTFAVITVFDGDIIHLVTESGSGQNMYTADTNVLSDAIKAIEISKSVNISLLQAQMLMVSRGANVESAMNQALSSDIPNSAAIMIIDGSFNKLYKVISESYDSAFDFVSQLQSNAERSGFNCEPASAIKASLEELGNVTIGVMDEKGIKGSVTVYKQKH